MKKGTYIAKSTTEGSVMFRVDGVAHTLRKGSTIEVEVKERSKVSFPASYMTLTLKNENQKSESKPKVVKKEIKDEPKVEEKVEEVKPEPETKVEEEPKPTRKSARSRKKSVKIETEEK
jgi:hypothetical protein